MAKLARRAFSCDDCAVCELWLDQRLDTTLVPLRAKAEIRSPTGRLKLHTPKLYFKEAMLLKNFILQVCMEKKRLKLKLNYRYVEKTFM